MVGGTTHQGDAVAASAQTDNATAYNDLAAEACNTSYSIPTDLGGTTLSPGVYCFSTSAAVTGTLTLNGDANSVFIFQIGSTLTTAASASVVLTGGAQPCNVFWQVGSSATLGAGNHFAGDILALASITLGTNSIVTGSVLAQTGAVTMDGNAVSVATCAAPPVNPPPTLSKSFSPSTIDAGDASLLTITLANPATTTATLTSTLTDKLPAGVVVTGTAANTCGGSVTITAANTTVVLTGGSIAAGASCTVTVDVTSASPGTYINSLLAGALQTSNGANVAPAVATLIVATPTPAVPALGKSFSPSSVTLGGVSTLTLTLSNSNPAVDALTAPLTDQLPVGLSIDGVAATTCNGVLTATMGSSSVTLTGGYIPANGSCTVTVNVLPNCACSYHNSVPAGALQTADGANASPAVATLTVSRAAPPGGPPTVTKYFYPANIQPGGVTSLTITLNNPNATAAVLTAPFTDNLPAGVLAYGGGSDTCGGTVSAVKGSSSITLTGGAIPANLFCTITVKVAAANNGTYINAIAKGALQTSNGSSPYPAHATLIVSGAAGAGPKLAKSFSPATIYNSGVSTLTITLKNPSSLVATLIAPLIDNMPSGMLVYGAAANTCGGAVTAIVGSSTVTLTGGAIPANGSCTVTVPVTAHCNNYFNNLLAGALQTSNGSNQESSGAALYVLAPK